jgi:NAD(P)-dependent dehydrogenase (short-subunit alcohol dehydrogenase family)
MSPHQWPLGSPFGAASTARDVIAGHDLTGRTAVVTGGYSGLGLETVRVLSATGAQVIVPARQIGRAHAVTGELARVDVRLMDLLDPRSIDAFARGVCDDYPRLDLLINAAGVMATPLARTAAGVESQFAINHLGHFRLTARLWPALVRGDQARVVSYSSGGHQIAAVDFDDINFDVRPYDKWVAYGQSKTANVLFALELDRRGAPFGPRAFSLHPGTVLGPLARHLSEAEIASFNVHDADGQVIVDPERDLKTAEQGAATGVWCATSPMLDRLGGLYCENCDVARPQAQSEGYPGHGVAAWAIDPDSARALWTESEALCELTFLTE